MDGCCFCVLFVLGCWLATLESESQLEVAGSVCIFAAANWKRGIVDWDDFPRTGFQSLGRIAESGESLLHRA
jgi:hypothetical protein